MVLCAGVPREHCGLNAGCAACYHIARPKGSPRPTRARLWPTSARLLLSSVGGSAERHRTPPPGTAAGPELGGHPQPPANHKGHALGPLLSRLLVQIAYCVKVFIS